MADNKDDLDLGEEKKGGKKKLILMIVGALLLFVGGGGAVYFLVAPSGEQTAEGEAAEQEVVKAPAIYHKFDPAFVVNLEGKPGLMQVGIEVRVRDPLLDEFLTHNDPMIRDRILNVLGAQEGSKLRDRASKEALQGQLLAEIQKIVKDNEGPAEVESLYFTSFVLQ